MNQETSIWLKADQTFDGQDLLHGAYLQVNNGRIAHIGTAQDVGDQPVAPLTGLITPGFIDLQVNGGGGVLFNADPTPNGITAIEKAHRAYGTQRILPTVITDAPEVMERAADAIIAHPDPLGIHIEGPHISLARRGTHDAKYIRPLDERTFAVIEKLRAKNINVMLTVAPEAVTPEQITRLVAVGVIVSIGHTDTDADKVQAALNAGAHCFTHLFNAMSPMQGRSPGVVGAAINSGAYVGIICDGIHVADEMVGLAIRARPVPDHIFAVSDAMPTVGGNNYFDLYGKRIHLENGRLVNAEGGLAGAHVTMMESYRRLVAQIGVSQEQALRMCHTVPLDVMFGTDRKRKTLIGASLQDVLVVKDQSFERADAVA